MIDIVPGQAIEFVPGDVITAGITPDQGLDQEVAALTGHQSHARIYLSLGARNEPLTI